MVCFFHFMIPINVLTGKKYSIPSILTGFIPYLGVWLWFNNVYTPNNILFRDIRVLMMNSNNYSLDYNLIIQHQRFQL